LYKMDPMVGVPVSGCSGWGGASTQTEEEGFHRQLVWGHSCPWISTRDTSSGTITILWVEQLLGCSIILMLMRQALRLRVLTPVLGRQCRGCDDTLKWGIIATKRWIYFWSSQSTDNTTWSGMSFGLSRRERLMFIMFVYIFGGSLLSWQ
jgi:hypothetical protein